MGASRYPVSIVAADAPARPRQTGCPADMARMVAGRSKHPLGDLFGLANFGVNLMRLAVGDRTAGDAVSYADNDVVAVYGADGKWRYTRKDGTPY